LDSHLRSVWIDFKNNSAREESSGRGFARFSAAQNREA
jgi:hypothetical protein